MGWALNENIPNQYSETKETGMEVDEEDLIRAFGTRNQTALGTTKEEQPAKRKGSDVHNWLQHIEGTPIVIKMIPNVAYELRWK